MEHPKSDYRTILQRERHRPSKTLTTRAMEKRRAISPRIRKTKDERKDNRITEVLDRAWPQGQNMPCAPTDHPMPNLDRGLLNTQPGEVKA
jgi:hypothetical protein